MRSLQGISFYKSGGAVRASSRDIGAAPTSEPQAYDTFVYDRVGSRFEGSLMTYNSGTLNATNEFTLECWLQMTYDYGSVPGNYMRLGENTSANRWAMEYYTPTPQLYLHNTSSGANLTTYTVSMNIADAPRHLAFVFNNTGIGGGSDKMRVYIDGVVVANNTSINLGTPNTSFQVGMYCALQEMALYDVDKTDFSDRFNKPTMRRRAA